MFLFSVLFIFPLEKLGNALCLDCEERLSPSEEYDERKEDDDDDEDEKDFAGFGDAEVQASERKQRARTIEARTDISPSTERASRRKSSKAASERIHKFAKQLRSTALDQNGTDDRLFIPASCLISP